MKNKTLVIENVNFEQLETDRQWLQNILFSDIKLEEQHVKSLENIIAMLDYWSDKLYHEN